MMTKILLLLACVVLAQGRLLIKRDAHLPVPTSLIMMPTSPGGFKIQWQPVIADITGYKVKVWKLPASQTSMWPPPEDIPDSEPQVFTVKNGDETKVTMQDVQSRIVYVARVQAYNKDGDGPYSDPVTARLG